MLPKGLVAGYQQTFQNKRKPRSSSSGSSGSGGSSSSMNENAFAKKEKRRGNRKEAKAKQQQSVFVFLCFACLARLWPHGQVRYAGPAVVRSWRRSATAGRCGRHEMPQTELETETLTETELGPKPMPKPALGQRQLKRKRNVTAWFYYIVNVITLRICNKHTHRHIPIHMCVCVWTTPWTGRQSAGQLLQKIKMKWRNIAKSRTVATVAKVSHGYVASLHFQLVTTPTVVDQQRRTLRMGINKANSSETIIKNAYANLKIFIFRCYFWQQLKGNNIAWAWDILISSSLNSCCLLNDILRDNMQIYGLIRL